ncbi:pantoate--beta-alanine ligase [Rhodopirellula maiorica SM1]|uniref:Pantothenate synthetase n=1 Tax=Rhodopirellula maiorica SM1 TaxID=1265738 RepID=M5RTI3_9BACT|nr:pantoate--beta-alanine ligase [Rhodopirellula maiorica]EMI22605.1 pantoate--beta-alanine ligase [Rhodopirellula maiorica SM1]
MDRLETPEAARDYVLSARGKGQRVGIVPTMGALHQGHLSLAAESQKHCDATIATIFVNPTQFAPHEDLQKYPRTLEQDCQQLESQGVAAVFVPETSMIYPPGFSTYVQPPAVAASLEGEFRPDHFRGVATIVMKLFQILPATHAFFGRKDYQQLKVIEAMVRDLNVGINVVACDTVREPDGLALSSRNRYLDPQQRQTALQIFGALQNTQQRVQAGETNVAALEREMHCELLGGGEAAKSVDKIDYATIVDAESLAPMEQIDRPAVALIAAFVGQTRLIDNQLL